MGAVDVHSFASDVAMDWAAGYREEGLPIAAATLRLTLDLFQNDQMGPDNAIRGIAAAEAVAHALGRPSPEAARVLAGAPKVTPEAADPLVADAGEVLMAVAGTASPLRALWDEAAWDATEAWLDTLRDLRSRLEGTAPGAAPAEAEPEPEPMTGPGEAAQLEDIRKAISGLEYDIAQLRAEMSENFSRLAVRMGSPRE